MFHLKDNLYFGRLPDGHVRVVKFSASPHVQWWHNERACTVPTEHPRADGEFQSVEVILDIRISPEGWASIVSSVSKLGESGGRYYKALDWHNESNSPSDDSSEAKLNAADTERMNWLRDQGVKDMGWVARESTTGRGFRLHQTKSDVPCWSSPRTAIDAAMKRCPERPQP